MIKVLQSLDQSTLAGLPERSALFLYTPTCGTCKVARRMLDVISVMRPEFAIYAVDANYVQPTLQNWEIQSVPALVYVDQIAAGIDIQYAFSDVDSLLSRVSTFFAD